MDDRIPGRWSALTGSTCFLTLDLHAAGRWSSLTGSTCFLTLGCVDLLLTSWR